MTHETPTVPHKVHLLLEKYADEQAHRDGVTYEVIETDQWFEASGEPITDERRIAELDAALRQEDE